MGDNGYENRGVVADKEYCGLWQLCLARRDNGRKSEDCLKSSYCPHRDEERARQRIDAQTLRSVMIGR